MIKENNKLIAEFMGCELEETLTGFFVYAIKVGIFHHDTIGFLSTEFYESHELKYHKDRTWLRNVRLKIESLGGSVDGRYKGKQYRDIVSFIKEYNESK